MGIRGAMKLWLGTRGKQNACQMMSWIHPILEICLKCNVQMEGQGWDRGGAGVGQGWVRGEVGTGWDIVKLGGADKFENP